MLRVAKDLPLSEITFRRYEKPAELRGRDLVKRLCLSVGLLQPGDSRDVVVDVFMVLLQARKSKEFLSTEMIRSRVIESRTQCELPQLGIAHSNVRRQLKRLKDLFFIECTRNEYRVIEFSPLSELFVDKGQNFLLASILARVREYITKVDEEF